ncbi:T-cell surface glycoprotein CD3 zeta chain isoform X1 [Carcharodon carcharias]|uniref:T-cell surface glycoprotein CD3 zeta chain isoform X1 n=2 Tax=Carcharodon carcharias TaxID=13397 RepID=UPI001B7DBCDA|nr:T-cell surface glycoprotein CD3 zeta chain isoform X1 [Carcharodon carcharias]
MKLKWICAIICSVTKFHLADAEVMSLNDPKLCYILDGILFVYGIIVTGLYLKLRLSKAKDKHEDIPANQMNIEDQYQPLQKNDQDSYSHLRLKNRNQDTETGIGTKRNQRREDAAHSDTYSKLNPKNRSEPYGELKPTQQKRRGKGGNDIYQDLSAATQDTYNQLQLQPLPAVPPPPRR